jgi:hypothetical protein
VLRALLDYIGERSSGPLFLNRDGSGRLSYSTSYALIRRLARCAGIPAAVHPNWLGQVQHQGCGHELRTVGAVLFHEGFDCLVLLIRDANRGLHGGLGVLLVLGNIEQVIDTSPARGCAVGCKIGPQLAVGVVDGREDERCPGCLS